MEYSEKAKDRCGCIWALIVGGIGFVIGIFIYFPWASVALFIVGGSIGIWIGEAVFSIRKDCCFDDFEKKSRQFPQVKELLEQDWQIGFSPPKR